MPPTAEQIAKQLRKYCKIFANSNSVCETLRRNPDGYSLDTDIIWEKWDKYPTITSTTPPPNHVIVLKFNTDIVMRLIWEPSHNYYDKALRCCLPVSATYYKNEDRLEISYRHNYFSREEARVFKLPDDHRDIPQVSILKGSDRKIIPDEIIMIKNKLVF